MKKIFRTKKTKQTNPWKPVPSQTWQEWFSQSILSQAVLKFYHKHKRWPVAIDTGSAVFKELKSGGAKLTLNLR